MKMVKKENEKSVKEVLSSTIFATSFKLIIRGAISEGPQYSFHDYN